MYEAVGHRYATVNVRVLDGEPGFADSVVVSPKPCRLPRRSRAGSSCGVAGWRWKSGSGEA